MRLSQPVPPEPVVDVGYNAQLLQAAQSFKTDRPPRMPNVTKLSTRPKLSSMHYDKRKRPPQSVQPVNAGQAYQWKRCMSLLKVAQGAVKKLADTRSGCIMGHCHGNNRGLSY